MSVLISTNTPGSGDGFIHISESVQPENTLYTASPVSGLSLFHSKLGSMIRIKREYSFQIGSDYSVHRIPHMTGGFPDHYVSIPSSSGFTYSTNFNSQESMVVICYDPVSKYQVVLSNTVRIELDVTGGLSSWSTGYYVGLGYYHDAGTTITNSIAFDTTTSIGNTLFNNRTSLLFKVYVLDISINGGSIQYNTGDITNDIEISNKDIIINGINLTDYKFLMGSLIRAGSAYTFSSSSEAGFDSGSGLSYYSDTFSSNSNSVRIANDFFPKSIDKSVAKSQTTIGDAFIGTEYSQNGITYKSTLGVEQILFGFPGYDCQRHVANYSNIYSMTSSSPSIGVSGDYVLFFVIYSFNSSAPAIMYSLSSNTVDGTYLINASSVIVGASSGYSSLSIVKSGGTYTLTTINIDPSVNYNLMATVFEYRLN